MAHTQGQDFKTPEARAALSKKIEEEVSRIPDRDVQHYYRQALREKTRLAFNTYEKGRFDKKIAPLSSLALKKPSFTGEEVKLLAALINHPAIFDQFEEGMVHMWSVHRYLVYVFSFDFTRTIIERFNKVFLPTMAHER